MTSLVSALDLNNNNFNTQYGENNHKEYKWSSNVQQEQILQLSFQLLRNKDENKTKMLTVRFCDSYINGTLEEKKLLVKLLAHTRDIEEGKGEYAISFSIIKELYKINETMCNEIIKKFVGYHDNVNTEDFLEKPYGSWKDMKYLFNEFKKCPIELINFINMQLKKDVESMHKNRSCSLLAKWIPREKSKKFGWIHEKLAMNYFTSYGEKKWTTNAKKKAQTHYRQLVSSINKYLGTVQINQCQHNWKSIDFNTVTSITMIKQKSAFLNSKNNDEEDRHICKENLLKYMSDVKSGKVKMKGGRTSIIDFVKQALYCKDENTRDIINEMWKNNSSLTKSLEKMIAMVDTSGSMEMDNCVPLYSAIGLGIRVAEKSKLGKRVLTFSNTPSWINIDENNCKSFVDQVNTIRYADWGSNTDFYKAMELILTQIVKHKLSAEEVEELVLVVFSDMQFDASTKNNNDTVRNILAEKFYEAGIKVCGKGYKVPHILFWNLRTTNGFPELSYQPDVTMLSGYSPNLLNSFVDDGMRSLSGITPWYMLNKMLDNPRYNILEKYVS